MPTGRRITHEESEDVMDYQQLNDEEINIRVGESFGWNAYFLHPDGSLTFRDDKGKIKGKKNFCNNPADVWPIILKNRISLVWDCAEDASSEWWNAVDQFDECRVQYQSNLLRGAMIVFLMLRESANVQDNPV
ncbi:phage protein NinX family protein [Huaxiibacter chinensis]|uniref:phage protein NinX family protein n=1 Tax=Huaxiibacter chinensis TaxID=2899785 RepID=UPI003D317E3C